MCLVIIDSVSLPTMWMCFTGSQLMRQIELSIDFSLVIGQPCALLFLDVWNYRFFSIWMYLLYFLFKVWLPVLSRFISYFLHLCDHFAQNFKMNKRQTIFVCAAIVYRFFCQFFHIFVPIVLQYHCALVSNSNFISMVICYSYYV